MKQINGINVTTGPQRVDLRKLQIILIQQNQKSFCPITVNSFFSSQELLSYANKITIQLHKSAVLLNNIVNQ